MRTKSIRGLVLIWFIGVFALAYAGVFKSSPGEPPGGVGFAFAAPLIVFGTAYFGSDRFRQLLLAASPVFLVALHGWRFVGLGFIMSYYHNLLPPGFAWPAGLGDIAVALLAPCFFVPLLGITHFILLYQSYALTPRHGTEAARLPT